MVQIIWNNMWNDVTNFVKVKKLFQLFLKYISFFKYIIKNTFFVDIYIYICSWVMFYHNMQNIVNIDMV